MTTLDVTVILASTRPQRFGPTIARWFVGRASEEPDLAVELVDLAEIGDDRERLAAHVAGADAVVIVVPEYNHSFPGPLKAAIDRLRREWFAKPIGIVSYGGISGGLRAAEQLRLVFAELHAVTIRETISFHGARDRFDEAGRPRDGELVEAAARRFLANLTWWARALRRAQEHEAYPA